MLCDGAEAVTMIKRILVPMDFSAGARVALARAAELAQRTDGEVFVLHVSEELEFRADERSEKPVSARQYEDAVDAIGALADLQDQLQRRGVRARSLRVVGLPKPEILKTIGFEKIDLVLMGTRGRRGLARLVLGNVAEGVVRSSPVPVLVCRSGELSEPQEPRFFRSLKPGELGPIRTVLVPTDCELDSEAAIRSAFELAEPLGATVHLLHVYPPVGPIGAADLGSSSDEELSRAARARLQSVVAPFEHTRGLGKCLAILGAPASTIVETAQELQADLLVMGTHVRTGMKRAFLGSVAETVVREADCPVLVAKSASREAHSVGWS